MLSTFLPRRDTWRVHLPRLRAGFTRLDILDYETRLELES